jgi:hypothetical protein
MNIKQSGEYIAVKVPAGSHDVLNTYANGIVFKVPSGDRESLYFETCIPPLYELYEFECIGLVSEIDIEFNLWLHDIPEDELDQWLIIKKIK